MTQKRVGKYPVTVLSDMMEERIGISMKKRSSERLETCKIQTCFYMQGGVGKHMSVYVSLHNSIKVTIPVNHCLLLLSSNQKIRNHETYLVPTN